LLPLPGLPKIGKHETFAANAFGDLKLSIIHTNCIIKAAKDEKIAIMTTWFSINLRLGGATGWGIEPK
jgi:hypothetical protein